MPSVSSVFKNLTTSYKKPDEFEELLLQNKTFFVLLQPIPDNLPKTFRFTELSRETLKNFNLAKYTDLVGYGGESSMAVAISKEETNAKLVMAPSSAQNYPLLDYLHIVRERERGYLLNVHLAQSKATEKSEKPDFQQMTDLSEPEIRLVAGSIRNALQDTVSEFGRENLGIPEEIDLDSEDFLTQLAIAKPTFTLFASSLLGKNYTSAEAGEELLKAVDENRVKEMMGHYINHLFGKGIIGKEGFFDFNVVLNSIEEDVGRESRNHIICGNLARKLAFLKILANSSGTPALYVDLMKACDLSPEVEKTAKLFLDT